MDLDTYLDHGHEDVKQAIVQFAARRSYRLRQPWYIDGLRIEMPPSRPAGDRAGRIDVELKRKRGKTRLRITVGRGSESTKLAYELQSYLQDDRAYHAQCPPMCLKCGSPVPNIQARYCGRCGGKLVTDGVEEPLPAAAPAKVSPPAMPSRPVSVPQARPMPTPVVVERDPIPQPAATFTETTAPILEEPEITPAQSSAVQPTPAQPERALPASPEAEEDAIDPPEQMPAEAEAEAESDLRDENRPRRALAED